MPRPKFEVVTEELPERAILVGIDRGDPDWPLAESMAELERLVHCLLYTSDAADE